MNYILDPVLIHFEVYWTRAFFATPAYLVVNFQVQNVGFLLKRVKYSNIRSKSAPVDHRQSDVYNKSSESFRPKTKYAQFNINRALWPSAELDAEVGYREHRI